LSISNGVVLSVHTASTMTRQPRAFASRAMSCTWLLNVVLDVSPWTSVRQWGRCSSSSASSLSSDIECGKISFIVTTSAPARRLISAIRPLKNPLQMESTRVPGQTRLQIAISIAADPGPATPSTQLERVWKT
jgi:hypothetical protein